jgi:hypothetical protein
MTVADSENVLGVTRAENANFVIEQVRALGHELDPTCRLMEMHRALHRGHVEFNDPDFETALEAERDLQHLGFVFRLMNAHRANPKFKKIVKHLLNDSVLPQADCTNSPGRDAQFELYLAAICQNAGLLPVDYCEPDIVCTIDGRRFGIAAKRIKSRNIHQVEKHLRKGAKQISNQGIPGVIALDLSMAWNQENRPIISKLHSQMYPMIAQLRSHQFLDQHHQDIFSWVGGNGVLAVVIFDFSLRLRPNNQWGLDGMTTWLSSTGEDQGMVADYQLFYRNFVRGIPNLKDLSEHE